MSREFFDEVSDALVGFLPPDRRAFSSRRSGNNIKVWYSGDGREHYEVQLLKTDDGRLALELGFHAEHADASRNAEVLERLQRTERAWRKTLGRDAHTGAFEVGRPAWQRVSELWFEFDFSPDVAIDAAECLARYITALEPLRTKDAS